MNKTKLIIFQFLFLIVLSCNSEHKTNVTKINEKSMENKNNDLKNNSDKGWLDYQKSEFQTELRPFTDRYGDLGKEFSEILYEEMSNDLTFLESSNLSEKDGAKYFELAMMKTSEGWSDEALKNFKISCFELLKNQGFTENIEDICNCNYNKLKIKYHNPLIFDFYRNTDTLQSYHLKKCIMTLMKLKSLNEIFQ